LNCEEPRKHNNEVRGIKGVVGGCLCGRAAAC
jgi:hypothetical protein